MWTRGERNRRDKRPEGPGADTLQATGPGSLQLMILLGLALLVVALAGTIAYGMLYKDRVPLGVNVRGVDVGGLGRDDASKVLQAKLAEYTGNTIELRQNKLVFKSSPAQMGVQFDTPTTVDKALQVGKEGNPLEKLMAQFGVLGGRTSLEPTYSIDGEKFAAFAKRLSVQIDQGVVDGALKVEGGQVRLLPPKEGVALDQAGLRDKIEQAVRTLSLVPIDVPTTRAAPQITEQDLTPARTLAQQMISAPIQFTANGQTSEKWTLTPDELAAMVTFQDTQASGKHQVTATLNLDPVRGLAETIAADVDLKPLNARFDWNGGNLKAITQGRDGRALDVDQFVQSVQRAATSTDRKLELPMKVAKPMVGPNDGAKMGIKGQILERRTDYSGGAAERRYNVELGASRINGVVVAPGEIFSFVDEAGDVTAENGYKMGFAIIGADTLPDPGGGICQVSTTVFQSVYLAGYDIVELHPHAYRIQRYETASPGRTVMTGLDATIYPPDTDFRFKNNTDNYLLIQTRTSGGGMFVSLYGTKPDWTVSMKGPELKNVVKANRATIKQYTPLMEKGREVWVETAVDGVDVTNYRTVQRGSQIVSEDKILTRYRPERNVLLIGTGGAPAPPDEIIPYVEPTPTETAEPVDESPTPVPPTSAPATTVPAKPQPSPTKPAAAPAATPTVKPR